MTLLIVFCNSSKRGLLISIMASNAVKGQSSISLSHEILDGQPEWSRCSSFSSSSNDSAIFCNNRHNSSFTLGKRKERSCREIKRKRNSSGSSASSSLSYFSDKDNKKALTENSIAAGNNVDDLERLSCPEIGTSTIELQHETLVNDGLSCAERSDSVLPFRHNLRRNIRKKTCSCDCTATCTTLVVRRYKEIGQKTVEEETVISRTKVQTCTKNNATQELHNITYEKSYSPSKSESNRKRRSEVEKLYDSLHEIEWAKNFSPDNILRQIHVRQAASCSMFGRSPAKQKKNHASLSNKQKVEPDVKSNSSKDLLANGISEETPQTSRSTRSSTLRNRSRQKSKPDSSREAVKYRKGRPQRNEGINSSGNFKKEQNSQNLNSSELQSSKSSIESFELKENLGKLNIKKHINAQNSLMDCKFISNSAESVGKSKKMKSNFESPNSITTLIPKNCFSNSGPEIDNMEITSEYSLTPTFFDIAEEGIRTIDACFREVGAEVVISTCYEADSDLPLLTSVKDNNASDKVAIVDECPPILEPCISYPALKAVDSDSFKGCQVQNDVVSLIKPGESLFSKALCKVGFLCDVPEVKFEPADMSIHKESSDAENKSILDVVKSEELVAIETPNKYFSEILKKIFSSRYKNNSLIKKTGKRILNKYLKILRLKHSNEVAVKQFFVSKKDFASPVKRKNVNSEGSIEDTEKLGTLETENFESRTVVKASDKKVYLCKSPDKLIINHSKSSYMYSNHNQQSISNVTTKNVTNESLVVQKQNSNFYRIEQHTSNTSVATTHRPERKEYPKILPSVPEESDADGTRSKSGTFSCHYQSLVVNRSNGYTQVILKLTHGASSFFTVESLVELKEVLKRTGKDPNCHTLILNGIGNSFSMGLDLRPLLGPHRTKASNSIAIAVKDFIEALSAFRKPLVAVVNGAAYGLGMTVLNHADTIIASEKATFCMPQTKLGYFPEGGATLTLPRAVGSTVAMDLIMRGQVITAHEAQGIGLISEVFEEKSLPKDLISRVKILSKNSISGMETTKAMLKMHLQAELLMVLENESKLLPKMWLSDSCQKALAKEIVL